MMKLCKQSATPLFCLLACLLFLSACGSQGPDSARQVVDFLTAPGLLGRAVGTAGNVKAGEYIARQLETLGIEPFFDDYASPYPQIIYDSHLADPKLDILWPDGRTQSLTFEQDYSLNLAAGAIDAELPVTADAGIADPENYALLSDTLPADQTQTAGFGLMVKVWNPADLPIHKTRSRAVAALDLLPDLYQRLAAEGGVLRFSCADGKQEITAHNIIGRLKGADSNRAFIISAHFDGAGGVSRERFSTGAVDNASGVAAMLHCAGLLTRDGAGLPFDVVFCAFNGEETSLQGSAHAAPELVAPYEKCVNINLDCVGQVGAEVYSLCDEEEVYRTSPLVAAFAGQMDRLGLQHSPSPYASSDHRSFSCPALAVGGLGMSELFHSTGDTPDLLDIEAIEAVGQATAQMVLEYTGPFYHRDPNTPTDGEALAETYMPAALAGVDTLGDVAGSLAYDQAYCFALEEGVYATLSGWRPLTSTEECAAYFPGIVLPRQAGDYAFQGVLVYDGRNMTADAPVIQVQEEPPYPLDTVFQQEPEPSSLIAVYQAEDGTALQLLIQRDSGRLEENDAYVRQEGIVPEGELFLLLWEGKAISAAYRREGMVYTLSRLAPDQPHATLEDYESLMSQSVSEEELLALAEAFDLFSLDIQF